MSTFIRYASALIGLWVLACSGTAMANVVCPNKNSITINLPASITAPRDSALGTLLTPWVVSSTVQIYSGCTASSTSSVYLRAFGTLTSTGKSVLVDGKSHVLFATSVQGVGLVLEAKNSTGAWVPLETSADDLARAWSTAWSAAAQVRLVATGAPIASGTLASTRVGVIRLDEDSSGTNAGSAYIWISSTTTAPQTCSASAGSVNIPVDLGTTSPKGFNGPVGSTVGNANFNIRLECANTSNVYMTLTDANNLSNTSDTLTLSPSASQAQGIGIQVRRSGTPVRFGPASSSAGNTNQMFLGKPTGGVLDVPFTANFIKTASTVMPGDANAVATYTLSYQ